LAAFLAAFAAALDAFPAKTAGSDDTAAYQPVSKQNLYNDNDR